MKIAKHLKILAKLCNKHLDGALIPIYTRLRGKPTSRKVGEPLGLDDALEAAGVKPAMLQKGGVEVSSVTSLVSGFSGQLSSKSLARKGLKALSVGAEEVLLDRDVYPLLDTTGTQIAATHAHSLGRYGGGVKVAVLDSGCDLGHPDLKVKSTINTLDRTNDITDITGHGTHISCIVAGKGENDDRYTGIAPECELLVAKCIGPVSAMLQAFDWAASNEVDIINCSVGLADPEATSPHLLEYIRVLHQERRILVCVAAGNEGHKDWYTITCPADSPYALSVGAVDKENQIAVYSSCGPTRNGLVKPDILAPGGDSVDVRPPDCIYEGGVIAARSQHITGEPLYWLNPCFVNAQYMMASGTSQAAPHASGAAAIVLEQLRKSYGKDLAGHSPSDLIRWAILSGAKDLGMDVCQQGYGLLQIDQTMEIIGRKEVQKPTPLHPSTTTPPTPPPLLNPEIVQSLAIVTKSYKLPSVGRIANLCLHVLRKSYDKEGVALLSQSVLRSNIMSDLRMVYYLECKLPAKLQRRSLKTAAASALQSLGWTSTSRRRVSETSQLDEKG